MINEELLEVLRRVPLFATLPAELLEEVVGLAGKRSPARGEILFNDGDEAVHLPILLRGKVKLYRLGADGREQVLHLVKAPASFAEAAVFGTGRFPATAEAVSDSDLLTVPRAALLDLLRRRPEAALALLASLSMWLRRLVDLVEGLSLHTVEERVCAYLWSAFVRSGGPLQEGAEIRLDEPKFLIAALCGTAPEVLSRTFRRLEEEGLVRIDGAIVTMLDAGRLHSAAGLSGDSAPP